MTIEYTYIRLGKEAGARRPDMSSSGENKTTAYAAFEDRVGPGTNGKGKRRYFITREGDTVTVTPANPTTAQCIVDVPWSRIAFAERVYVKPEPASEPAPEPTTGARPSAKFNPGQGVPK